MPSQKVSSFAEDLAALESTPPAPGSFAADLATLEPSAPPPGSFAADLEEVAPPLPFGQRLRAGVESAWSSAVDFVTQRPLARAIAGRVAPTTPPIPAPPAPWAAPPTPVVAPRPDNQFVEGAMTGVSSLVGGAGGIIRAARTAGYGGPGDTLATNPVGTAMSRTGEALSAADAAVQGAFPTPEQLAGDITQRPELLADPAWWQRGAGNVLGSASPYLASLRGASLLGPGVLEAMTEGGNAYNEALADGKPPEAAAAAAAAVTAANLAIVPGFNRLGQVIPGGKPAQMAVEAVQEATQEVPQNVVAGRPAGEGVANAFVLGGLGAVMMPSGGPPVARRAPASTGPTGPPIQTSDPFPPEARRPQEAPRPVAGPVPTEIAGTRPGVQPATAAAPPVAGPPVVVRRSDAPTAQAESVPPAASTPSRIIVDQTPATPGTTIRPGALTTGMGADQPTPPADPRPWLERAAEDAVEAGAFEDVETAMEEIERRGRSLYTDTHGQAANEGDDHALLERIRDVGGLLITDTDLDGEMRHLREFLDPSKVNTFAGVRNVLRRKKTVTAAERAHQQSRGKKAPTSAGLPMDTLIQAINEDPRFAPRGMQDHNAVLNFLVKAAVDHREGRQQRQPFDPQHFGEGAGVRLSRRWWRSEGAQVRRSDTLAPEADAVQERFARAIEDDLEGMVARYREQFGNVIDADKVKALAGEDLKTQHEALHAPSSWLADELFDRAVSDQTLERGLVVFTGGGPGSGKSSAVERSALNGVAAAAVIQRDSAFANPERAREMLQAARDNGHTPTLFYVYTDPIVAWQRQAGRDRTVSAEKFIQLHRNAIQTARMMAAELGDDLFILDNTGTAPVLLEDRPSVDIIEELAQNYPSHADLRARLAALPAPEAGAAPARGSEAAPADARGPDAGKPDARRPTGPPVTRRSAEVVDTLDTGEQQPRLPGEVGAVRDQDVKPVEFDAPFSLTREAAPDKKRTDGELFMATRQGGPPIVRKAAPRERAEPDIRKDGGDSSPARAVYDAPPNPPKGITPPRQPVSEAAVVTELARIFGHEQKDVPGPLRGVAGRLPIPVKAGVQGKRAFGYYSVKGQGIRLRKFGDLGTFVHELGHDIDFRILAGDRPQGDFESELNALGTHTSPPTATKQYRLDEGVAEFFRYWFSNPDEARLQAPRFAAAFEAVLARNPALAKQFEQGRIVVQKYLAQDLETRGRARIDFSTRNIEPDGLGLVRTMEALWVDDLASLRQSVEHLANDRPIDIAENAYVLSRLARGASAKASGFLAHGTRNDAGQFTGPSFRAAIAPVQDRLPDFSAYLVARRAMELKGRGIEPGMKLEEAKAILAKHDAPAFETAAQAVYAFQDSIVDYAVEAGVVTARQASAMRKLNRNYVPFWRILTDRNASSGGRGGKNSRPAFFRIKGSGRDLVDPIQAIVRNTHAMVELVEQHKAMVAFIRQAEATPGGGLFLEEVKTPQVKTQFGFDQIREQLVEAIEAHTRRTARKTIEAGRDPDAEAETFETVLSEFDVDELLQVFTPATSARGNDRTISVMHEGRRVFYHVTDPGLYEALTAIGPKGTSLAMRWFFKVAGAPARTLRAGATLTFGFIARNPARDAWVAYNQSDAGFKPGVDSLRGLFSFLKQDEYFQAFLNSGGGNASMVSRDRNVIARELRALKAKGKLREHLASVAFHPIDVLRALSDAGEMMTRMGEFRRMLHTQGVTKETLREGDALRREEREAKARVLEEFRLPVDSRNWRLIRKLEAEWAHVAQKADEAGAKVRGPLVTAALASRDVTVDFARKGSLGGEVNQVAAFFNARVQGYSRLIQTFRQHPGRTSARVASSVTLLSIVLWALNKDDDEYNELPGWQKDTYWHIPLKALGGDGWLRIPKPFEFATLFGTMFERALDQITERDPVAWKRLFTDDPTADASELPTAAAKGLAKEMFSAIFPTAVLPLVESMTNYSFFREKPIVSPFDIDLPAELQYNRWTSETAKVIGRGLGVSPAMIDHMIMGYGAGLARGVVENGVDQAIAVAGGPSKPPAPAVPIDRMPGVGVFAKRFAGSDAESIAELYRRREQLRTVKRTAERYLAEGRPDAARGYVARFPDHETEGRRLNAAAKQLEQLRDLVGAVYAHPTLEPQDKRELLDRLDEHMVNVARRGLGRAPLPSRFASPMPEALARKAFARGGPTDQR